MDGFIAAANLVAASIQKDHFPSKEILEFKNTENKVLLGHLKDTKCRPDITAAFRSDWNANGVTLWPCAQLAGERASKGRSKAQQEKNAISYLHYLLLARPDLYVAQGLLIDDSKIIFLLGIGGYQIRRLDVRWGDEAVVDWIEEVVEYSVQIRIPLTTPDGSTRTINCANFRTIAARNPFTTRTHVLSNPKFKEDVNGKALTVLKDQLCRAGTRFDEKMVLETIHSKGVVPGVVEVVLHETIQNCWSKLTKRLKHRFGLRQFGLPFASIPTPRKVLEVLFDVLEVLRYLRSECRVLHRDISAGNVLYTNNLSDNSRANVEIAGAVKATTSRHSYAAGAAGQEPSDLPVFVKYLLGQSDDKQQTSMLLIDFNRAELLNRKQSSEHLRISRTGTQLFIARAVENTAPVPFTQRTFLPEVPQSPGFYALNHPTRIEKFPFTGESRTLTKPEREQSPWSHGLEHDVESVFWLLLYWAIVVQPANHASEPVHPGAWGFLLGNAQDRNSLVRMIADGGMLTGLTHSTYNPLGLLIRDLASTLVMDRQWLVESDVRNDSTYICEAFQRLILHFLLRHTHQDFMNVEADVQFRSVE